jgi:hypothetical protein
MSKIGRYEPKEGDTIDDLLLHQEMLIMYCNKLLPIVHKLVNIADGDYTLRDLVIEANALLKEIGE